jgi:hypothetical protein
LRAATGASAWLQPQLMAAQELSVSIFGQSWRRSTAGSRSPSQYVYDHKCLFEVSPYKASARTAGSVDEFRIYNNARPTVAISAVFGLF